MRPITKIFLLIVVAFVAYLLWPRKTNLAAFQPEELAKRQVAVWRAEKAGNGMGVILAVFRINSSQYQISPITAFRMAQSQEAGWRELKNSRGQAGDPAGESRALTAWTEKYSLLKGQMRAGFDADALGREDLARATLILDGAPAAQVAGPLARILAAIYGGEEREFADVATNVATAQVMAFGDSSAAGEAGEAPEDYAREGYKLLKEIASVPPGGN